MPQRPVRTVMHSPVHALRADTPAREAERFLTEHNIGGAPVLDDKGCVVGVLSQRDLLRLESAAPSANATGAFFSDVDEYQDVGDVPADQGRVLVERLMTRDVLFIDADAPVWEAARLMRERRVHRLIVT